MRSIVVVIVGMLGLAEAATADLPAILRGPIVGEVAPVYRWSGAYGGAQIGYSVANIDFANSASSLIAFMLRNTTLEADEGISKWTLLEKRSPVGLSYGGFVGYNSEWEDAVLGFEVSYSRMSLSASSGSSMARTFTDSNGLPAGHHYYYTVSVNAAAAARITDLATFRLRGGWDAGRFLPYAFAAFAVGRADLSRSATLHITAVDATDVLPNGTALTPLPPLDIGPDTSGASQNGLFTYGAGAGLGMDVALLPNLFLRGEWEYVQLAPLKGTHIQISTVRSGLGLKF